MRLALVLLVLCGCGQSAAPPGPAFPYPPGTVGSTPTPLPAPPPAAPQPAAPGVPAAVPIAAVATSAVPVGFRVVSSTAGTPWSFAVPTSWQELPPPVPAILMAVRDPVQTAGLYSNVNLLTEPYAAGDGAQYASANLPLLASTAVVLGQRPATVGALAGADIEARWAAAVPPYRTLQRYTAVNGLGYVLTCTGADAAFEAVRPTCDAILNSFRVSP